MTREVVTLTWFKIKMDENNPGRENLIKLIKGGYKLEIAEDKLSISHPDGRSINKEWINRNSHSIVVAMYAWDDALVVDNGVARLSGSRVDMIEARAHLERGTMAIGLRESVKNEAFMKDLRLFDNGEKNIPRNENPITQTHEEWWEDYDRESDA